MNPEALKTCAMIGCDGPAISYHTETKEKEGNILLKTTPLCADHYHLPPGSYVTYLTVKGGEETPNP